MSTSMLFNSVISEVISKINGTAGSIFYSITLKLYATTDSISQNYLFASKLKFYVNFNDFQTPREFQVVTVVLKKKTLNSCPFQRFFDLPRCMPRFLEFDAESFVAETVFGMILKEEITISPSGDDSEPLRSVICLASN